MRPWLLRAGLALGGVALVVAVGAAILSVSSVPAETGPEGALLQLAEHIEAGDLEQAQIRLCPQLDEPNKPRTDPAGVIAFLEQHDFELATGSGGRRVDREHAAISVTARPRGAADAPAEPWTAYLERDPGGSGPRDQRSLRWSVCRIEPTPADQSE